MPWNDQRGGGRGPWGQGPQGGGPSGGGGLQPPELDEVLRKIQERLKGLFPGGGASNIIIAAVGGLVIVWWLASGLNVIQATERGVVLRFGEYVETLEDGFHWRLPVPIEIVERVPITRVQLNIGGGQAERGGTREGMDEGLMLTGDENIVDVDFTVFWRVRDPNQYLFEVANVEGTIKAVAESAMREVVGQTPFNGIVTEKRSEIQQKVRTLMQSILDSYKAGVVVMDVALNKAVPPPDVIAAFRDVQAASADADRERNEADRYRNQKVPEAIGLASQIVQAAEAYKEQAIAEATGEAQRFVSIFEQYRGARSVTRERMYLETMEKVLGPMNKIILTEPGRGGVQPYLAIPPELLRRATTPSTTATASGQ